MSKNRLFIIIFAALLPASQPLHADTIDKIKFLKVSEQEGKAVVKDANGKLQMVGVGDVIDENGLLVAGGLKPVAGNELRVIEIAKDRIVLERQTEGGPEKIIIRLEKGKQKVEIVSKERPRQQAVPVKAVTRQGVNEEGMGKNK